MKVDYIIVGAGLAGIAVCEALNKRNLSHTVFAHQALPTASTAAAGLYNPVVLKRFTAAWKASELMASSPEVYRKISLQINKKLDYKQSIFYKFSNAAQHNHWVHAAQQPALSPFMKPLPTNIDWPGVLAPFGVGHVQHTGRIDTKALVSAYASMLLNQGRLINQAFEFSALQQDGQALRYMNIEAKHIVFCEGMGLKKNPFFKQLPLVGTKGQSLIIHAPKLVLEGILKSAIFLIPLENSRYWVGATYDWHDHSLEPTVEGQAFLIKKLKQLISVDFIIEQVVVGIRPTVTDRRPLVGTHPNFKNIHLLNGLGTRGVLLAPYAAQRLIEHIEEGKPLEAEINLCRFPFE